MRCCDPFDIPVPTDLKGTLGRVQALLASEGGHFAGDEFAGRFSGTSPLGAIEGRYTVQAEAIRITITSKPMLLPCGTIEARIREQFA